MPLRHAFKVNGRTLVPPLHYRTHRAAKCQPQRLEPGATLNPRRPRAKTRNVLIPGLTPVQALPALSGDIVLIHSVNSEVRHLPGAGSAAGIMYDTLILRNLHFYQSTANSGTKRNPHLLGVLAATALISENWSEAGKKLHTYADSWAHEGFTALPSKPVSFRTGSLLGYISRFVGHADAALGGYAPDYPFTDISKVVEAATAI